VTQTLTRYAEHYRKWHDDSDAHLDSMRRFYAYLLGDHMPPDRSAEILDVGCGMGFALDALRAMGYTKLRGIDLDEGQLAACRAKNLSAELVVDSVAYLHSEAGRYDTVLLLDVLEHVPVAHQPEFCEAIWASLKRGGTLVLTVPNANSALAARWRYIDFTHHSSFTEHSLEYVLGGAGFSDFHAFEADRERAWPKPDRWISGWPFSRWFWSSVAELGAFRLSRALRRVQMWGELGQEGWRVPLSLNLLGVCRKP
jgi:SAM-dependent methyltransferase